MKYLRIIAVLLALVLTATVFFGCSDTKPSDVSDAKSETGEMHVHTPGPEATCSTPQICTVCNQILSPVRDHLAGAPATCTAPSTCQFCGKVLSPALGHTVGEDGICSVCGQQIETNGSQYTGPNGGNLAKSGFPDTVTPETIASGHYHNTIDAYTKNAVLICGDYGMEYFNPFTSGLPGYADAVNAFVGRYPDLNVTVLLAPKCCTFESPEGWTDPIENTYAFINATYNAMADSVKKADALGVMEQHRGEYLFYRTDHHWTSLGAYYASRAYCDANGITPYELESYETIVKTDFIGSLYTYAGKPDILTQNPDYTVGHYPHTGYTMSCYAGYWYGATAINPEYSNYANMFIDGDVPLEVFETDVKNGKCLIVFKESYGNAFVPYMLDYYERVVVVDIREETDSVKTLIDRYGVTDVLVINNIQAAVSFADKMRDKILS